MIASSPLQLSARAILFSLAVFSIVFVLPSNGFLYGQASTFRVTVSSQSIQQERKFLSSESRIYLSEEGVSDFVETEESSPPKPAVKCPDCDKCDGSGRYVY